ncbi:hypothetical protein FRACYDRAFT_236475 [Fragilariopsis cylindrus CCMP1102]|uniref:Uncharacterized protein n=1 Tax=Fragilariopsis cylindrus CCMP1102 TaxID=635003 RepID=A0A1E7FJA3_9STRA|nr:hypothetical protein FRACYDRAFT_236475 [Fragilariopsis cylindrus CCMP1102]|eukprot:OEU18204.1 hypothetical protein FRACYDRAFT_236475 [Fragilariopsis cylindrus CCMP1102]
MPVSLKNNTIGEYYPPQLLSQKLNNRAAFLITTGHYEEGIALLTKALKLTSNSQVDTPADQHQATCNCKACSLESCLIMEHEPFMSSLMIDQLTSTQNQGQQQEQDDQQGYYCPKPNTSSSSNSSSSDDEMFHRTSMGLCSLPATASQLGSRNAQQRRNLKSPSTLSVSTESPSSSFSAVDTSTATTATTTITDFGFVYRRPLLVNQQCIDEMHDMGITLSLLILFNLALAHHLKAIASFNTQQVSSSLSNSSFKMKKSSLKALQQALKLYELAYQLHIDYIQQSEESSSVSNNNQQPQESESSSSSNNDNDNNDSNSDDEYNRSIGSLRFTMIISNNLGEIHHAIGNTGKHTLCLQHLLSAIMYVVDSNLVVLDSNEMDGFYSNVAPIMGLSNKGYMCTSSMKEKI